MKKAKTWTKGPLQAHTMRVGVCENGELLGFDMAAEDGGVYAHGHFDLDQAEDFLKSFLVHLQFLRDKRKAEAH